MNTMRAEAIDWLDKHEWDLGITLTFKHDVSEQKADRAIGHMWNRVDRALYGNAAKRYGKRVERVNVFENNYCKNNLHCHIGAKVPANRTIDATGLRDFIAKTWKQVGCAGYINDFQFIYNSKGWTEYITKDITATSTDVLNLRTTHFITH